jgi:hypothetical protein
MPPCNKSQDGQCSTAIFVVRSELIESYGIMKALNLHGFQHRSHNPATFLAWLK